MVNLVAGVQPTGTPCPFLSALFDQCTTVAELMAMSRAHERIEREIRREVVTRG